MARESESEPLSETSNVRIDITLLIAEIQNVITWSLSNMANPSAPEKSTALTVKLNKEPFLELPSIRRSHMSMLGELSLPCADGV